MAFIKHPDRAKLVLRPVIISKGAYSSAKHKAGLNQVEIPRSPTTTTGTEGLSLQQENPPQRESSHTPTNFSMGVTGSPVPPPPSTTSSGSSSTRSPIPEGTKCSSVTLETNCNEVPSREILEKNRDKTPDRQTNDDPSGKETANVPLVDKQM